MKSVLANSWTFSQWLKFESSGVFDLKFMLNGYVTMEGVILIYLVLPKNIIFSGHLLARIVDFDISDTPFQWTRIDALTKGLSRFIVISRFVVWLWWCILQELTCFIFRFYCFVNLLFELFPEIPSCGIVLLVSHISQLFLPTNQGQLHPRSLFWGDLDVLRGHPAILWCLLNLPAPSLVNSLIGFHTSSLTLIKFPASNCQVFIEKGNYLVMDLSPRYFL